MQTIWIHQSRPRPTWYELDSTTQDELRARWAALDTSALNHGADRIGEYSVRGQSDYSTLEVWKFPSPEASFTFWSDRVAADYSVWFTSSNQVGITVNNESTPRAE